jgi:hypothetical protein
MTYIGAQWVGGSQISLDSKRRGSGKKDDLLPWSLSSSLPLLAPGRLKFSFKLTPVLVNMSSCPFLQKLKMHILFILPRSMLWNNDFL